MVNDTSAPAMLPENESSQSSETPRLFFPTPERLSQFLEKNYEEVETQLMTNEGKEQLLKELKPHAKMIREEIDPTFDVDRLERQLTYVSEELRAHKKLLSEASETEKKGILTRAMETVKNFAVNHPITTTMLVAALAAAATAAGFYYTGNWEMLLTYTGAEKWLGGAEAARDLLPVTPATPALPGGGMFEVAPPTSPPDIGILT